ncbi:phage major capsid protein [Svornostia abyssi]|uniref:Phage major capsid protein n=1 Tax=Svornostia abyssi TaxID=2898438 RepID=A0ABY5PC53_9ACTN|nr:phage major capsid protein [Parviterribacteraceae bacterium J379]
MAETALEVLEGIRRELAAQRGAPGTALEPRSPSRMVGPHASKEFVEQVAAMASHDMKGMHVQDPSERVTGAKVGGRGLAATMKALAEGTDSAGGYLVANQLADEVLTAARARSAVVQLGPRVVDGIGRQLDLTRVSTGATAYWPNENAPIPISEPSFSQDVVLRPRDLSALVPVSNRLLRDAADVPDAEDVIVQDLSEVIALAWDLACLAGSGSGNVPTGILSMSGTQNVTTALGIAADGDFFDDDLARAMVGALRNVNSAMLRPGWVFHSKILNQLESLKDNEGRPFSLNPAFLEIGDTGWTGKFLGYPFAVSNQLPTNETRGASNDTTSVIFADWSESWIGVNRDLTLDVSREAAYTTDGGTTWVSAFQNRQTLFRCEQTMDFTMRRPNNAVILRGLKT